MSNEGTAAAFTSSSVDNEDERQYALVSCSPPVSVSSETSPTETSKPDVRHEILELYESFAESFPNSALQQENNERDRLLRAISAADHAVQLNPAPKRTTGWFSFGRQPQPKEQATANDVTNEDARLKFTDRDEPDTSWLLGTEFSLDATSVPDEAHSVARWHLLCHGKQPNAARTSWEIAGTSVIVVTGLGSFVEWNPPKKAATGRPATTHHSSDRRHLQRFWAERQTPWSASRARAALVGPNLLVVSWGLDHGTIVLYRRRVPMAVTEPNGPSEASAAAPIAVTWEAVAYIGPSQTVHDSLADVFDESGGSTAMTVTDLVPLVVELNNAAPAVTLAVSRLGGFVELVPLPPKIWYGPELPAPKKGASVGSRRRPGEHYAIGKLFNVTNDPASGIVSFATSDYHGDILGLDMFRTSVDANASVEWNQQAYPHGPPAEHVLAAYGTEMSSGHQCVSFWSVSTILSGHTEAAGPGFSVHAALLDALDLGRVGPDMTLFCTPKILRYWRKPRRVELRDTTNSSQESLSSERVTTISVSAPMVGLRFVVSEGTDVRAAVLDWNGGVSLLDCNLLQKSASQSLSPDEYNRVYGNQSDDEAPASCIKLLANRSQVTKAFFADFSPVTSSARFSSLEWFRQPNSNTPSLAALSPEPCTLRLARFDSHSRSTTVTQCLKRGVGTLLQMGKNKRLFLVFQCPPTTPAESLRINFCALHELSAGDIVQSFVRSSKYREAVEAAEKLSPMEQDSIAFALEDCKRRLWESELDFSMLQSLKDDAYIIHEALYLYQRGISSRIQVVQNGDVPLFRSVCQLALQRIRSARLGASLSFATSVEGVTEIVNEIRSRLVNIGTYELLGEYLACDLSLYQFFHSFMTVTANELALHFAQTAEIAPLSIVLYRHQHELTSLRYEILNNIPLSMSPRWYQHLLPIVGVERFTKFMVGTDVDNLFDVVDMEDYLIARFKAQSTVDKEDKALIGEFSSAPQVHTDLTSIDVAQWYTNRALAIHRFISNLACTSEFTKLALCGLRLKLDAHDASGSPAIDKLYRLFRFTETVRNLQADGNEVKLLSTLSSLEAETFAAMDTRDLVGLVLNCKGDSVDLFARYSSYLVPLMRERLSVGDVDGLYSKIDSAIEQFCVSLIQDCLQSKGTQQRDMLDAVNVCSKICWSSRTSIAKAARVIKNKTVLVALVLSLADDVASLCTSIRLQPLDQRRVLDYLWKMYESIPTQTPPGEVTEGELSGLLLRADHLYKKLVIVEMVVRWSDDEAFFFLRGTVSDIPIAEGENVVSLLCRSFLDRIGGPFGDEDESRYKDSVKLLSSLLDEINELNAVCFQDLLSLKLMLVRHLFTPLLHRNDIKLLGELCLRTQPDGLDNEVASRAVLSFLNDCVDGATSGNDSGKRLRAAMECQDVLGQWLPSITQDFQTIRQHLDAAHYINSVLLGDNSESLSPEQVRIMFPLDVVEYVLERNPRSIVVTSEEWEDPIWARKTNETFRAPSDAAISKPLPAQAIFRLAQLLHLDDVGAVIAVKSRVVHHAVSAKLYGAAAAVCRTLAIDSAAANADRAHVLCAVAQTVSQPDYEDDATKQELCAIVLAMNLDRLSSGKLEQLSTVRNIWDQIDRRKRFLANAPECKLFSIGGLFLTTRKEYATELSDLFLTLQRQVVDCVLDDALLAALARYTVFWCIGRSTQSSSDPIKPLESSSTRAIIELSASLLLSIHEQSVAKECGDELSRIFREQLTVTRSAVHSSPAQWTKPDLKIVQALIGRGYSECGARRAAAMTENKSVAEALQWSVMHSLDADFNDPLAVTKSARQFYDSPNATTLESTLSIIESIISGDMPVSSVWRTESANVPRRTDAVRQAHANAPMTSIRQPSAVSNGSHASFETQKSPPTPMPVLTPAPIIAPRGSVATSTMSHAPQAAPAKLLSVPLIPARPAVSAGLTVEIPVMGTATHGSPARSWSSSTRGSPDRSTLLQVGQAAFQTARSTSSPSMAERQRLMEQGRLLLQRTRSTSGTPRVRVPTPPASAPGVLHREPNDTLGRPSVADGRLVQKLEADADRWDFDEDDLDI